MTADVEAQDLDSSARRELRALGRTNAESVARHLVMVQRLLDTDPELAYQHARFAASHAGRVAVVRESAGIAAYLSGHYNEALRDIHAARRLSGLDLHRAIEADCERALGRYERALRAAENADPSQLDDVEEAEIAMVVSGIRHELGESELGLIVIEEAIMMFRGDRETLRRLHSVRADRLEELGRVEEAERIRERIGEGPEADEEEDVEVYDLEEETDESEEDSNTSDAPAEDSELEEEAADWPQDFNARVEAEMAELLGETASASPEDDELDEDDLADDILDDEISSEEEDSDESDESDEAADGRDDD